MEENNQKSKQEKEEHGEKEVKKEDYSSCCEDKGFNFGGLFFGIFLVFIGLLYLAKTIGLLNVEIDWWQFWPVLIILAGLSMISGKGWVSVATGIAVTLVVLGIVIFTVFGGTNFTVQEKTLYKKAINIEKEPGAKKAVISVKLGAAEFDVVGGGEELVSGNFESNFSNLVTESTLEGNVQKITLKTTDNWTVFSGKRAVLDLRVNSGIPLSLNLETGATDMALDLSDVMAEDIDIDTGASSLEIVLGDKVEKANLNIDAGASSVKIVLSKAIGAVVRIDTGLSSKNLTDFREITPSFYQSANYETSQKKIDMNLNLGVSSLDISWK